MTKILRALLDCPRMISAKIGQVTAFKSQGGQNKADDHLSHRHDMIVKVSRRARLVLIVAPVHDLSVAPLETIPADMEAVALTTVGQLLVVPRDHPLARGRKSG